MRLNLRVASSALAALFCLCLLPACGGGSTHSTSSSESVFNGASTSALAKALRALDSTVTPSGTSSKPVGDTCELYPGNGSYQVVLAVQGPDSSAICAALGGQSFGGAIWSTSPGEWGKGAPKGSAGVACTAASNVGADAITVQYPRSDAKTVNGSFNAGLVCEALTNSNQWTVSDGSSGSKSSGSAGAHTSTATSDTTSTSSTDVEGTRLEPAPSSVFDPIISQIEDQMGWSAVPEGVTITAKALASDPSWAGVQVQTSTAYAQSGGTTIQPYTTIYHLDDGTWTDMFQGQPCVGAPIAGLATSSEHALCAMGGTPQKSTPNGTSDTTGAGQRTANGTLCGHVERFNSTVNVLAADVSCQKAMRMARYWATQTANPNSTLDYDSAGYYLVDGMICNDGSNGTSCGTQQAHVFFVPPGTAPAPLPPPGTTF